MMSSCYKKPVINHTLSWRSAFAEPFLSLIYCCHFMTSALTAKISIGDIAVSGIDNCSGGSTDG